MRKLSLFASLALTDLALTWLLLRQPGGGAYEGNPIASWCLARFGWSGLALFKLGIVGLVGMVSLALSRHQPRLAGRVLTFGCAAHLAVIVYSSLLVPRVMAQGNQTAKSQAVEQQVQRDVLQFGEYVSLQSELGKDLACRRRSLAEAVAILSSAAWVHRQDWLRGMAGRYPTSPEKELLAIVLIQHAVLCPEASRERPSHEDPRLEAEFRSCFGHRSPFEASNS
jgi:hypothetical protein